MLHQYIYIYIHVARLKDKLPLVESELDRMSNWPEYSPVLLTWMLVNYDHGKGPGAASRSKQLGEKAVKKNVVKVIGDIANDSVIQVIWRYYIKNTSLATTSSSG